MSYELVETKIKVSDFDLKHTFESAQPLTFFGDFSNNSVFYVSQYMPILVNYLGDSSDGTLSAVTIDDKWAKKELTKRFRLNDDMKKIYKQINTDKYLDSSIKRYRGMRVTLNDPWETTVCFIISQFNNVKRIRGIIKNIVDKYGAQIEADGEKVAKTFPTSEELMNATTRDLLACGTGFRAKYIQHAAEYCTNNLDLNKLNPKKYDKLKEELLEINGIGDKVADCIILMGYGNFNAFPVDVWIKRTMEQLYFKGKKQSMRKIKDLAEENWHDMRGYAQQYLFHDSRSNKGISL